MVRGRVLRRCCTYTSVWMSWMCASRPIAWLMLVAHLGMGKSTSTRIKTPASPRAWRRMTGSRRLRKSASAFGPFLPHVESFGHASTRALCGGTYPSCGQDRRTTLRNLPRQPCCARRYRKQSSARSASVRQSWCRHGERLNVLSSRIPASNTIFRDERYPRCGPEMERKVWRRGTKGCRTGWRSAARTMRFPIECPTKLSRAGSGWLPRNSTTSTASRSPITCRSLYVSLWFVTDERHTISGSSRSRCARTSRRSVKYPWNPCTKTHTCGPAAFAEEGGGETTTAGICGAESTDSSSFRSRAGAGARPAKNRSAGKPRADFGLISISERSAAAAAAT
mmetsp:Transcript_15631/g.51318  ORF Transcript_15631/g.51318 Transcript_15631/m.51318 type:complete len:338 (-) Transcript_15631:1297-2310(-)